MTQILFSQTGLKIYFLFNKTMNFHMLYKVLSRNDLQKITNIAKQLKSRVVKNTDLCNILMCQLFHVNLYFILHVRIYMAVTNNLHLVASYSRYAICIVIRRNTSCCLIIISLLRWIMGIMRGSLGNPFLSCLLNSPSLIAKISVQAG